MVDGNYPGAPPAPPPPPPPPPPPKSVSPSTESRGYLESLKRASSVEVDEDQVGKTLLTIHVKKLVRFTKINFVKNDLSFPSIMKFRGAVATNMKLFFT